MSRKENTAAILIVCHGRMAQSLYQTLEMIIGVTEEIAFVNFGMQESLDNLEGKVLAALEGLGYYPDNAEQDAQEVIIFADLFGGSCANLSATAFSRDKNIHIICGVNLPMILEAYFSRNKLKGRELVSRIIERGRSSIVSIEEVIEGGR